MSYKYSSKRKENLEQQKILLKIESEEADTTQTDLIKPPPVTPVTKNPVLAGDMVKEIEEKKRDDILSTINELEGLNAMLSSLSTSYAADVKTLNDLAIESDKWKTIVNDYRAIAFPTVWEKAFGSSNKEAEEIYNNAKNSLIEIEKERLNISNKWLQNEYKWIDNKQYLVDFSGELRDPYLFTGKGEKNLYMPPLMRIEKKKELVETLEAELASKKKDYISNYLSGSPNPEFEYESILDEIQFNQEIDSPDKATRESLIFRGGRDLPGVNRSWYN